MRLFFIFFGVLSSVVSGVAQEPPAAVFVGGKIVTADAEFRVREAFAVRGGKIVATGTTREMRALAREGVTAVHDLGGRMVLPGLIDSHVHAPAAAMFEFDHEIPPMETLRDVLDYIAARTRVVPAGVPRRTPDVTIGFSGSKGMAFLLQVRCARLSAASATLPVSFLGRRSTSNK